ncbi:MAG TPA: galactokinase, partial [Fimbriimonas sp.]|nr:galactokinase [Fimbriimonas sp.]
APGRINLIGEHTDYNDGFVFPAAIDRVVYVAAARMEGTTVLFSEQTGEGDAFDAQAVEPGQVKNWSKYPAGVAWALRERGLQPANMRALLSSDIPMGSGVSSSAALEMVFGVLHRAFGDLPIDNKGLALNGQVCENRFVGVNSGIMDQMASALGREGQAMFLDTRSLKVEYAPIPVGLAIVLCDTKKERELTTSAYNERRAQCEEAASVLGVKALRDASLDLLETKRSQLAGVVYRRAKHVITEDDRSVRFKAALAESDLGAVGELMKGSHESLRDDFEVSCRELDLMAEAAWKSPGCVGARMTGGGFGGACVALVERARLEDFSKAVIGQYDQSSGLRGEAMACKAVEGARLVATL